MEISDVLNLPQMRIACWTLLLHCLFAHLAS